MQKNKTRPGYKKTKVGWIPEGWKSITLGSVADVKRGAGSQYLTYVDKPSDGIRLIRINDFLSDDAKYVRRTKDIDRFILKKGDILIAGTGATAGITYLIQDYYEGLAFSYNAPRIRGSRGISPIFLYYQLNGAVVVRQQHSLFVGNAQHFLDTDAIKSFSINLPPLPEQEAIAEVLECWDKGVRTLEKKIEKKRLIKKGLMQKLLSGQTRLPGFSKGWKNVRLGKISEIRKGQQLSRIDQTETGEYPVLNGGVEPLGYTDQWNTEKNIITISEGGNSCGFVNFNSERFWCGGHCYALAEDEGKAAKSYLFQFLKHKEILVMRLRVGSGLPNIQKKALEHFEITLPPLEEQRAIAEVLSAADGEIVALERKLALWKDQKKYLLNNLVTGTLRLPEFQTTN